MKILSLFILASLLFFTTNSCNREKTPYKQDGNIRVYYENLSNQNITDEIISFWNSNQLTSNKRSDIKIIEMDSKFQLLLIVNDKFKDQEPGFEDIKILNELQERLNTDIEDFHKKPCEIALADNQFQIKFVPNPL